ncbi:unnamed protein product [Rotaria magnacalcarata]
MPDVQLLVIIQYINIYIVFFAASIGTIGNILHIITFTCLKTYHTIPSSIFLVRASFAEQLTTIGLLFPQSIGYATGHDTRVMSCLFCKISSVLYTGGGVFTLINFFSQQTDAALQRHIRSNGELKQQHKVLLSTLLLEQRLHSTATNEHKRLVKEVTLKTKYYLVHKKNKVSRPSLSTVDFYLNNIIREATSIVENDCVKQTPIGIENLTKEIIAQEILLIRRHRDLEQE